ncbi:MAG: 7-carboxy-7-deazaguanine synthase QueE [Vulcanisaeta sp.]|nr:7-carboxy-7-deazaguanine synthase QueE [Vulcanisaeta sp.]
MKIVEIFRSRQGEGPNAGKEAVFLRLALCNLRCVWCDTKYSWRGGVDMSVYDVCSRLMSIGNEVRHLVITGGEPLLWLDELMPLLRMIKSLGWYVEVETNGTIPPNGLVNYVDEFNVSPKLSNSGLPMRVRINELAVREFVISGKAVFKFVIENQKDGEEVLWFINKFGIPRDRIYLMSQCTSRDECIRKDEEITKPMASRLGIRFTPRLHIIQGFK